MSKVVVVISGGRFLRELNLPDDETLTPQAVCNALAELTVEERQSLTDRCTLSEMIEDVLWAKDARMLSQVYHLDEVDYKSLGIPAIEEHKIIKLINEDNRLEDLGHAVCT